MLFELTAAVNEQLQTKFSGVSNCWSIIYAIEPAKSYVHIQKQVAIILLVVGNESTFLNV